MKTKNITAQLNLTLPKSHVCQSLRRARPSHARAAFWFHRMRQIVETAPDWPALPSQRSGCFINATAPVGTYRQ